MFTKEMRFREKPARITCSPGNQSVRVQCDGIDLFLSELELLRLKSQGFTAEGIAATLGLTPGDVRNRFWALRKRNDGTGTKDSNAIRLTSKVRDLDLLNPIALDGLRAVLDEGMRMRRAAKKGVAIRS